MRSDGLTALITLGWYNGYSGAIKSIRDHIADSYHGGQAKFPEQALGDIDCDLFPRIFWSVLVLMFGDYGTSPRFGWISMCPDCVDAIDSALQEHEDECDD